MSLTLQRIDDLKSLDFDTIIDVRSPAEYALDHIPGAINLPALSNEERAEVGTLYKQVSPFDARKLGASLVLKNVADHIAGPLHGFAGDWKPLVYCWRGGQRSSVFATLLKEVGWRADTISGGYQTYRRAVFSAFYEKELGHKIVLLDGYTGTAKTAVLTKLAAQGVQVIDLEKLAGHRGSLLGQMPGGQPSQKRFETLIASALAECDPNQPTVLEAESSKIGRLNIPPALWAKMCESPRILLSASLEDRVAYSAQAYRAVLADPKTVTHRLAGLRSIRGHAVVDHWGELHAKNDFLGLARALIEDHYDPAYATSRKRRGVDKMFEVKATSLSKVGLDRAASEIIERLSLL